ncbi:Abi family protein [Coprococcus sp. AF16-5]|uniref:Abi family protein n=1 Tax=Coprococcus sp. AF16-5 TaxID=2293088 RepID=UPI000E4D0AC6|nr:Abi family protein [Coprococcus sp. AF16-5]RHR65666.1 Abi family protein [Coprococcus sp. AF16-5]
MQKKPKSINALMAYMRDTKGLKILGSGDKKKLRYMGYFHGYKGYRYHNNPTNMYTFNSFDEVQAIYEYDMAIKTMFYPEIMFLETTFKNYVLEVILEEANSKRFADIYAKLLTDYKSYPIGSDGYKKAINKRMNLRNKVYSLISRDYGKRFIVNHYYDKDQPLPIWAIFELICLGEFGTFIDCLAPDVRKKVSESVGIKVVYDGDGKLLPMIVYTLKDLRNSVAHNNIIFDTRFKTGKVSRRIDGFISAETGITNIKFDSIVDYVILISFMMKLLKCPKKKIMSFIKLYEKNSEELRAKVSTSIFNTIVYTDTRTKLELLKKYL